jgi:hypothetical protein
VQLSPERLPPTVPLCVRKQILAALFRATAEAFERPVPVLQGLSFDQRLEAYACFTRDHAEQVLRQALPQDLHSGAGTDALTARLYQKAEPLGRKLRAVFRTGSMAEVVALVRWLYRAIGVELVWERGEHLQVDRCYFSGYYSAPVCALISALDDGIFAGLSGGGGLRFSERLTEGGECCRARVWLPGDGEWSAAEEGAG